MRKLFNIDDTITNKISYWHLVGFLITLPFDRFYSELILASFAFHSIIHFRKSYLHTLFSREVLILVSIYLLGALSILYSSDRQEGIQVATKQLALLLFPVFIALNGLDLEKYRQNLFSFFALSCTFAIIYLYVDAFCVIARFNLPASSLFSLAFMNHNFSSPIGIHATYLSLYVGFSIIVLLHLISAEKNTVKYFYICCILILCLGLLQLSSRSVCIALMIVITFIYPMISFAGKKRVLFMLVSMIILSLLVVAIMNIDSFKERYVNDLGKDLAQKADLVEFNEPRVVRWKAIMEIIKGSPVIGYGTGSEHGLLQEKYFEKKLFTSYLNEFNTHSEYLSFTVKMGIVGFALFIFVLYTGFATAWRERDFQFLGFMTLISIVCVAENLLDLNKGIFFYSFFFSLFLIRKKVDQFTGQPDNRG